MKQLKYAIIGCGSAGKVHGFHFSKHPKIQCIAVLDVRRDNALYFQKNFGFHKIYDTYQDLLSNESLDVVSICTPPKFHAEQIRAAAKKKIHILCEISRYAQTLKTPKHPFGPQKKTISGSV